MSPDSPNPTNIANAYNTSKTANTIIHPLAKFAIGLTAGLVAVAIPRLSSDLSSTQVFSTEFYTPLFISSMLVFALLIGVVITILEYKVPRTPKDTLFSALAIPALVAGSLNTAIETQNTNQLQATAEQISQEARRINHIEVEPVQSIEVIHFDDLTSINQDSIRLHLFATAHADTTESIATPTIPTDNTSTPVLPIPKSQKQLFINRQAENYAVSLFQFSTKEQAIEKARNIKQQQPQISVIKINDNRFDVLSKGTLMSESDATLEALKAKNDLQIRPIILKLK